MILEQVKQLSDYPKEITDVRESLEMSFVMSLWKNPELYDDYVDEINPSKDLMLPDGKFFYSLGKEMYGIGYKSFDDASIHSFIHTNEVLMEGFIRRGGIQEVDNMRAVLNEDNIDTYFDSLVKNNMLMKLHDKGFNVVNEIKKFNKMNTSQLYDYFEYQLDNVFLNRGAGVKIEDLSIDEEFILECHAGTGKGLSYSSTAPLMNYHTLGLHKSNVQVYAGYSGTGKTSYCMATYVFPILDAGENIVIIANEMNIKAWKNILLITILTQKMNYFKITRKKLKMGNFSEEELEMLYKAKEYQETYYNHRIKFAKIFDYSIEDVKRIARKMAKQGYRYVLYDTFKSEDASSSNATGELVEASKQLLQVAEKEDISVIITMQLALHTEGTRYLNATTLSGAKAVKEVVSELILMRSIWDDEFNGEKYDIRPYKFKRDPITGKLTKIKEYITLDVEKKYRILFLDKTRNDEGEICIVNQFDGAWNVWREIGYCTVKHQRSA